MIPFHSSFESDMCLTKHTRYWNISSRYIPFFLMCFGTPPTSTVISPWYFSSLSHCLWSGLPAPLDEVSWTSWFWSPLVLLYGFSSRRVLRIVTQDPSSAWLCQQSAVAVKTQTWISCLPSSPEESSNTRSGWAPPASVACRKALGAWQHKCILTQDKQGVQLVSLLRTLHQLSTIIEEVGVSSPFQAVVG